jgi:hypothetical protein
VKFVSYIINLNYLIYEQYEKILPLCGSKFTRSLKVRLNVDGIDGHDVLSTYCPLENV